MLDQTNANIERHIKTHTERSDDDRAAVSVLETFLRSNGRINTSFASDDKWPNHDNTFEFVPNPEISRRPVQTFYVQIKGTRNYTEREGVIKYTLKDLAFPAFICGRVSLDPGILFVILNPAERGNERVFWKYTGTDEQDKQYYELVANAFSTPKTEQKHNSNTRFYIQKRTPFYVGKERYFEVTLQQADIYASKYNRITAYTKLDISTSYSVQIDYVPSFINLWGVDTEIKIITAWRVSVDPKCLNKLGKILNMRLQLSSKYGEYDALMRFLTETGMDFLEMIDLREIPFSNLLESVYKKANTSYFKDVLQQLRDNYSTGSTRFGRYTIRYLLLNLREDLLERVMPSQFNPQWKCRDLYLSKKCFPFERNPLASDLADSKTSQLSQAKYLARVVEKEKTEIAVPYWSIVKSMQDTGEIYCNLGGDLTEQAIQKYNDCLDDWERQKGYEIISDGNVACIAAYERCKKSSLDFR